jgi:glycosyltransferase involved in cell wall biosynthesis
MLVCVDENFFIDIKKLNEDAIIPTCGSAYAAGYDLYANNIYGQNSDKDWILQIYGDGEQRDLLLHLIREAKLEDAVVVNQSTRQIMDKYLESSIFLLTSRFEGFGMVLIEAMACGVPVVSFDCPWGPADIIKNGEDGFLVEYLNTTEAAEKVVQLIESPELRMKMGIRARENVQRYGRNTVMKQWIDLFYSFFY